MLCSDPIWRRRHSSTHATQSPNQTLAADTKLPGGYSTSLVKLKNRLIAILGSDEHAVMWHGCAMEL
jgi:hypothetical protein